MFAATNQGIRTEMLLPHADKCIPAVCHAECNHGTDVHALDQSRAHIQSLCHALDWGQQLGCRGARDIHYRRRGLRIPQQGLPESSVGPLPPPAGDMQLSAFAPLQLCMCPCNPLCLHKLCCLGLLLGAEPTASVWNQKVGLRVASPLIPPQALQLPTLAYDHHHRYDRQDEAQHTEADADGQRHVCAGMRRLRVQQWQVCLHVARAQAICSACTALSLRHEYAMQGNLELLRMLPNC